MKGASEMELLKERAKTHGNYDQTAKTAQMIKRLFQHSPAQMDFSERQKESLDMIAVKLARIMCGDPHEPDHWRDLAGYALLAIGAQDDT